MKVWNKVPSLWVASVFCASILTACQGMNPAGGSNLQTQTLTASPTPTASDNASLKPGEKKSDAKANEKVVPRGLDYSTAVEKFAFGSGANQNQSQPIWKTIQAQQPDLFIFVGNTVLAGDKSHRPIGEQYQKMDKLPEYREARSKIPFLAIWNDQDFGQTFGGGSNPEKEQARKEFLSTWSYIKDSIGLNQAPLYHSKTLGGTTVDKKRRRKISKTVPSIHFVMLDTRWNRDPLVKGSPSSPNGPATQQSDTSGPMFVPTSDNKASLLGETQWEWLEEELQKSDDLIVLVSPIQVFATEPGFEKWSLFPKERERLFQLIKKTQPKNLLILSGDRPIGAIAQQEVKGVGTIYEITSGNLNLAPETNDKNNMGKDPSYQGELWTKENFGLVTLDWPHRLAKVELKDIEGKTVNSIELKLRR